MLQETWGNPLSLPTCRPQDSHSYKTARASASKGEPLRRKLCFPWTHLRNGELPSEPSAPKFRTINVSPSLPYPVEESHSQYVRDETKAWKRGGKLLVSFISIHNIFPYKIIIKHSVSNFYLLPKHQRIQLPAVTEAPYRNDSQLESGWHGLPEGYVGIGEKDFVNGWWERGD